MEVRPEEKVRNFYDTAGWDNNADGNSQDAELWEDLRPAASDYVSHCRLKLLRYLPKAGEKLLDAASGPIQYPEYLEYSRNFSKRVCVDISQSALDQAKTRLGSERGEFLKASLVNLPLAENSVDAAVSLHTIYHIDKNEQERAVRELLRVTKSGGPLLVIYANPWRLSSVLRAVLRGNFTNQEYQEPLYYFAHPLFWWRRFSDVAEVEIVAWRSLTAKASKFLCPDNFLGKSIFSIVRRLEDFFPRLLAHVGAYPLIILRKR